MITFKHFIENLWGEIPVQGKKPSDGQPHASKMSMSSNTKSGGAAAPMGNPFGKAMMKKMAKK